jgi:hypothetical protein
MVERSTRSMTSLKWSRTSRSGSIVMDTIVALLGSSRTLVHQTGERECENRSLRLKYRSGLGWSSCSASCHSRTDVRDAI